MWWTMRAVTQRPDSLTTALHQHIAQAIAAEGGWLGFDRFMALALYTPGLGYYANDCHQIRRPARVGQRLCDRA